jgi:acyl-ACP thioesterase
MIEAMMAWIMVMKGREEMHGSREEVLQEERKKKENKTKRKQKKEQKRKEKNAELPGYADALRP